jgi:hypothetical protein
MDAVDEIGVAISSERVGDELGVSVHDLAASAESALWGGISHESIHIIALECGSDQHLSLDVGWCFLNVGFLDLWILVIVELHVVPGEFILLTIFSIFITGSFGDSCIDVDCIPLYALACGFISDVGLRESVHFQSVLVHKSGCQHTSRSSSCAS